MRVGLGLVLVASACAAVSTQTQADLVFHKAMKAQADGVERRAEAEYRRMIDGGFTWSSVYNNLAVIAVHRHEYIQARRYLAAAVQANRKDVVALTNYGVMSYYLADLKVAETALADARALRQRLIVEAESERERISHATETIDRLAAKYLEKIARAEIADGSSPLGDEFVAENDQDDAHQRM